MSDTRVFGAYGGRYVPETLIPALDELDAGWAAAARRRRLPARAARAAARPTRAARRRSRAPRASRPDKRVYLKREDLLHTGAHKLNNALGQAVLARRLGKQRIVAETGAGQHGVATATVCARFGLECVVYMGAEDMRRQAPNVERMHLLGAEVRAGRVRDADAEGGDERGDPRLDHERRDDPLPDRLVRRPRAVPGARARAAARDRRRGARAGARRGGPAAGGGRRVRRRRLERDRDVLRLHPGRRTCASSASRPPARRRLGSGRAGVLHGARSSVLADDDGQIARRALDLGRARLPRRRARARVRCATRAAREYVPCTDEEALAAFHRLRETEGIIPALECSHALARALDLDAELVFVCLSGRGDKDLAEVLARDIDVSKTARRSTSCARPETPELAEAAVEGGADIDRARHPVLRPARRGPDDPPRRGARARAGHAHGAVPRVPRRDARARRRAARADDLRVDPRGLRLRALRRRTRAPPARRARSSSTCRPRSTPRCRASSSSRRPRPTSGSRSARRDDRRLALPRHRVTGTTGARAERRPHARRRSSSARARATDVPLYAGFGISTPEHARAVAELADGVVVGSRAVQVAEEGPGGAARRTSRSLQARRSTRERAVVVGAGVFGASTARALARRGWDVTLVEQYAPGNVRSASGGDTRLLRMAHGDVDWYAQLACARARSGSSCRSRPGVRIFEPVGVAWFAQTADGFEARSRDGARPARHPERVAGAGEARGLYPSLGVRRPAPACSSSRTQACCTRAARRSCSSRTRSGSVRRSRRAASRPDDAAAKPTSSSGRAAPGCRSSSRSTWRSRSSRRDVFFFGGDGSWRGTPGFCDYDAPFYGHGEIAGLGMKIAPDDAGDEVDPDTLDRVPSAERQVEARAYAARRFPALADAPIIGARVCQYDLTGDTHFLVAQPSGARALVDPRRRLGPRLQARPGARRLRRGLHRGSSRARGRSTASAREPATPGCGPPRPASSWLPVSLFEREHQLAQQGVQLLLARAR